MLTWLASGGFSLDASVRIHGSDLAGRERLLRYCARPPLALERLHIERPTDGRTTTRAPGEAAIRQVPLLCPGCGAEMRIVAFITVAELIDAILRHLGLPTTPPPLSTARGPPQPELGFDADPGLDMDQTPSFDPTEPEPVPDFDFDQIHGD
jgi:hypothetical protein